ncbi:MAG: acetate kinase [Candidatus Velthaea sp.]
MRILTVNAGSTSLKLERYDLTEPLAALADPPAPAARYDDLSAALRERFDVVAHRFVLLPDGSTRTLQLDDPAMSRIAAIGRDAPLHNAHALELVNDVRRDAPHVPQIAVSDSAFHRTLPPAAYTYAIPERVRAQGFRRLGYHGLSHEYAAHRAARQAGIDVASARIVTLHLGGGSSLCALHSGRSVDTTMGYTPLEGIPMATRSGSIDPGLLIHLLRGGTSVDELERILEHESGLLGLSNRSGDVRELLAARGLDAAAGLALDVFVWRTRAALGAMAAVLGGVDLAVFTGGIGEHAGALRESILIGSERFGIVAAAVVEARENWMLARAAFQA